MLDLNRDGWPSAIRTGCTAGTTVSFISYPCGYTYLLDIYCACCAGRMQAMLVASRPIFCPPLARRVLRCVAEASSVSSPASFTFPVGAPLPLAHRLDSTHPGDKATGRCVWFVCSDGRRSQRRQTLASHDRAYEHGPGTPRSKPRRIHYAPVRGGNPGGLTACSGPVTQRTRLDRGERRRDFFFLILILILIPPSCQSEHKHLHCLQNGADGRGGGACSGTVMAAPGDGVRP